MIIGVMSDTHGSKPLMRRVARQMAEEHGVELILHLGDDYADAEDLQMLGYRVLAVPGLWCPEYTNPRIPNTLVERVDGVSIALAHADKDWGPREKAADIALCGHTHRAAISRLGKRLIVNPGHLKREYDRAEAASYAIIRIENREIAVVVHELDGQPRLEAVVERDGALDRRRDT